jgi:hypothetical protein
MVWLHVTKMVDSNYGTFFEAKAKDVTREGP